MVPRCHHSHKRRHNLVPTPEATCNSISDRVYVGSDSWLGTIMGTLKLNLIL